MRNWKKNYKVIQPELISFISYPYEWCFSQLKNAAITTLEIQKIAIDYNMTLKDASSYNIQFRQGKPILIDTLSFEKYQEGFPFLQKIDSLYKKLTPAQYRKQLIRSNKKPDLKILACVLL